MLNVPLYNALVRRFGVGAVHVHKEDVQAEYELPNVVNASSIWEDKGNGKGRCAISARLINWGEVYQLNCPRCGDTRERLYISHMFAKTKAHKIGGRAVTVMFGRVYICHNEQCDLYNELRQVVADIRAAEDKPLGLPGSGVTKIKTVKHQRKQADNAALPQPSYPLLDVRVPTSALAYLLGRRFIPGGESGLATKYDLHYAPEGAVYLEDGEEKRFYDERLVIPVYRGRRVVSWQARVMRPAKRFKYINMPGFPKTELLYNMDNAWEHRDVVLVEGVTDVWRVGDNAVCGFGKTLATDQIEIMRILWGYCGRLLIVLDPDASAAALEIKAKLDKADVFPRGVFIYTLPDARDPADYDTDEIRGMLTAEFARLEALDSARRAHRRQTVVVLPIAGNYDQPDEEDDDDIPF
jgi:hypothetical protein